MPNRRNTRKDTFPDWDSDEMDKSFTNGHNHNLANPADVEGASEYMESNGNGYTNNQAGGGRSTQSKASSSTQSKHKATLGPWTLAVGETLQSLKETQRNINNLQEIFISHSTDLERIDETGRMIYQLVEECRQKDDCIKSQKMTIRTLTDMSNEAKAQIDEDAAQLERDKIELRQEKEKQEKRVNVAAAEEKLKVNQEFEKRTREYDELHEKRNQELEEEIAQKRDEIDKREMAFEAEKKRLLATVEKQDKQIKEQAEELEKMKEQYEVLQRAKDSFKKEMLDREVELEAVKKEFALDPRSMDYFTQSFAEIENQIERISGKYFHGIEGKEGEELEQLHKELAEADPFFDSVPVDDTDDSRDLCTAHAQRIISKAICEDIWVPFSSEFTALQPESSSVLSKISDEIDQSDHGGRTAKFWNARTIRALKSLSANSMISQVPESMEYLHPVRTKSVISKVLVLSPLVSSSQVESLRTDLVNLVNWAVEVWDNGQAGGSKITVNLLLDRAYREEWRSQQFDPASEGDETNPDLTAATRSRIFPLFPQVLATGAGNLVNHGSDLPGSWPTDSDLTIIHHGKGLPEWSPLVVRGQTELEERRDALKALLEETRKHFQSNKRALGGGRRCSGGSVDIKATD